MAYLLSLFVFLFSQIVALDSSQSFPWRDEPFALVLVKEAEATKRAYEKKEYLRRIVRRLNLRLPLSSFSDEQTSEALHHLHTLFFSKTSHEKQQSASSYLKGALPSLSYTLPSNEVDLIDSLKKADLSLFPEVIPSWDMATLQLNLFCLDLLPLITTLNCMEEKIEAINWYLFFLVGVRYPPLSESTKKADHFSSLGPILSGRQGICLGTSILFASVCQRLNIPTVAYTPPGHAFVAVLLPNTVRVVETTARGAFVPLIHYESLEEPRLSAHPLSLLVACYIENKAAQALMNKEYDRALFLYEECSKRGLKEPNRRMLALLSLLMNRPKEASQYALEALKKEAPGDPLLMDIGNITLSSTVMSSLFDILEDEDPQHIDDHCTHIVKLIQATPASLALRYQGALLLFRAHRIVEAKRILDEALASPTTSLPWQFLSLSLMHELHDSLHERQSMVAIMNEALLEGRLPHDLIETGSFILHQNPDCAELTALLQRAMNKQFEDR